LSDTRAILVQVLRTSSLLFAIPSVLVSTPRLPVPLAIRRVCKLNLSKVTLIFVVILLSLTPPSTATILNDVTLLLALIGTYFLPGTCTRRSYFVWLSLHLFFCSMCSHRYTLLPTASIYSDAFSLGPEYPPRYAHLFSTTQFRPSSPAQREATPAKAAVETNIMGCRRLVAADTYQPVWIGLGWRTVGRKMVALDPACGPTEWFSLWFDNEMWSHHYLLFHTTT